MFKSFTTSQTKPTSYREEIVARKRLYRPPVTDGLTLWLDPRNYRGSGDWYDRSRVGGAAALYNGVVHNGDYFTFDAVDDFMRVTRSDFTELGYGYQEITVNMFFRQPEGASNSGNLITVENSFEIAARQQSGARGYIEYASNPWAWRTAGSMAFLDDTWYMLTYVHTFSNRKVYFNGELINDNLNDSGYLNSPARTYQYLTIAGRYEGTSDNFGGDIGSVYIHDRALSQREIQYMFDLDRGRYGI